MNLFRLLFRVVNVLLMYWQVIGLRLIPKKITDHADVSTFRLLPTWPWMSGKSCVLLWCLLWWTRQDQLSWRMKRRFVQVQFEKETARCYLLVNKRETGIKSRATNIRQIIRRESHVPPVSIVLQGPSEKKGCSVSVYWNERHLTNWNRWRIILVLKGN